MVAIKEKLDASKRNNTWTLVPFDLGIKAPFSITFQKSSYLSRAFIQKNLGTSKNLSVKGV